MNTKTNHQYDSSLFINTVNSRREEVLYKVQYKNRDDYKLVEYVINRVGDRDKYYWAKNKGFGCYSTMIIKDTKLVEVEHFNRQVDYHFGRFILRIINRLEQLNENIK